MNKKEQRKEKATLTLLASITTFCTIIVTLFLTGIAFAILIRTNMIWRIPPTPMRMLLFIMVISAIVGLIATIPVSRFSAGPINNLINQINRLGSGDFKARLHFEKPISRHDTFSELEDSFNKMAEELENTEVLRKDFINNFSHEFKTPIVSIAGFAKLLKRGNLTEDQRTEYLDVIEKESLRLSNMATNVLNMTRVENLSILTDVSEFNLSEQLRSCILLFEDKWEQKNIDFELNFDEHKIYANEELLKQVWVNLIDNALKFSPSSGTIAIHIQDNIDSLSVAIGNTGPTIPVEIQSKLFNKFYQADESHSTEGNGIGLAIVKRVTDLHNGTVSVRSEDDFTTFTVELPKSQ